MENASKALIIAGAILLAILIISLGIMIYNQASGVVNNNAMSEVEIQSFNQKFDLKVERSETDGWCNTRSVWTDCRESLKSEKPLSSTGCFPRKKSKRFISEVFSI